MEKGRKTVCLIKSCKQKRVNLPRHMRDVHDLSCEEAKNVTANESNTLLKRKLITVQGHLPFKGVSCFWLSLCD